MRPFTSSWWYTPLPDTALLHANSPAIVTELVRQRGLAPPIVNGSQNPPIWTSKLIPVPLSQPLIPGVCTHDTVQSAIAATGLPIPPGLQPTPAPDTDNAVIIYQPDAPNGGYLWELEDFGWITPRVQWQCGSLARTSGANATTHGRFVDWVTGPGGKTPGAIYSTWQSQAWGIQGSGLPYAPGLLNVDDILRGSVNHALLLEVYDAGSKQHVWPAVVRSDGRAQPGTPAYVIAEGMWLRLAPGYVIDPSWSLITRLYAQGARDFGLIITDITDACLAVRCELDVQPYVDDAHLTGFPWADLQCLKPGTDATPHPIA